MPAEVIRELVALLGVEADTEGLDTFEEGIERAGEGLSNLINLAAAAGAAVGALAGALVANTLDVAGNADSLDKQASALGIGVEEYQRLAYALDDVGLGAEQLPKLLTQIAKTAEAAATEGTPAAEALAAIGLSSEELAGMSPDEQLAAILSGLSGITDQTEKLQVAQVLLGGDAAKLVTLMDAQGESLEDLGDKAESAGLILSEETVKAGADLQEELDGLTAILEGLRVELGVALLPVIRELVDDLRGWYEANKEVIKQDLQAFAQAVAEGFRAAAGALAAANEAIGGAEGWKELAEIVATLAGAGGLVYIVAQIYAIGAGLATAASGLAAFLGGAVTIGGLTTPIGWVVAAVAALAGYVVFLGLALEDLYVWFNGGTSLIGTFVERNREAGGVLGALAFALEQWKILASAYFGVLSTGATSLLSALSPLLSVLSAVGGVLAGGVAAGVDVVAGGLARLIGLIGSALAGLNSLLGLTGAVGGASIPAPVASGVASAPTGTAGAAGGGSTSVTTGAVNVSVSGAGITQEQAQALINDTLDQQARATASALEGAPV